MTEVGCEGVVGEWNNFIFKWVSLENKDKVFEHLRDSFYKDEPVCKHFGGSSEECAAEFEAFFESLIIPQAFMRKIKRLER